MRQQLWLHGEQYQQLVKETCRRDGGSITSEHQVDLHLLLPWLSPYFQLLRHTLLFIFPSALSDRFALVVLAGSEHSNSFRPLVLCSPYRPFFHRHYGFLSVATGFLSSRIHPFLSRFRTFAVTVTVPMQSTLMAYSPPPVCLGLSRQLGETNSGRRQINVVKWKGNVQVRTYGGHSSGSCVQSCCEKTLLVIGKRGVFDSNHHTHRYIH